MCTRDISWVSTLFGQSWKQAVMLVNAAGCIRKSTFVLDVMLRCPWGHQLSPEGSILSATKTNLTFERYRVPVVLHLHMEMQIISTTSIQSERLRPRYRDNTILRRIHTQVCTHPARSQIISNCSTLLLVSLSRGIVRVSRLRSCLTSAISVRSVCMGG